MHEREPHYLHDATVRLCLLAATPEGAQELVGSEPNFPPCGQTQILDPVIAPDGVDQYHSCAEIAFRLSL